MCYAHSFWLLGLGIVIVDSKKGLEQNFGRNTEHKDDKLVLGEKSNKGEIQLIC